MLTAQWVHLMPRTEWLLHHCLAWTPCEAPAAATPPPPPPTLGQSLRSQCQYQCPAVPVPVPRCPAVLPARAVAASVL